MAVGMYHSRGQILIGWGLMSVVGSKLSILKRAPSLSPKPLDRGMLAAIIERSIEQAVKPYLISEQEKDDRDYSEAFERGKNSASNELAQLRELKSKVEEFETASGVSINRWSDAEKIGEAVKAVLQHDKVLLHAKNRLSVSLRELIEDTVPSIKKSIAALEEVFDFSEVAQ
jgi:glutaredoxin 2